VISLVFAARAGEGPGVPPEVLMRASRLLLAIPVLLLIGICPAPAQNPPRFTFQPVEGGLMRLDGDTGQVSFCTKAGDGFACRSVADDRAALQEEIDRLRRENEQLKAAGAKPPGQQGGALKLPSEEDIDKAMGVFEKMMRRMMRTFREETQPSDRL
jgi:hypothetical protein